jgi:hypothetical protein
MIERLSPLLSLPDMIINELPTREGSQLLINSGVQNRIQFQAISNASRVLMSWDFGKLFVCCLMLIQSNLS